ncbi:MAG: hypothetical protein ACRD3E_11910, partial [Terriglobales bacterium]
MAGMNGQGMFRGGAALLWRCQRVLWWVFAVNLAAGLLASLPVRAQLAPLNASITARDSLYHQMNVFRLQELLMRPEITPRVLFGNSFALGAVFFLVLLFAIGGILEALYIGRAPRFADFLHSSAGYFWRMVRLTIVFAILMIPVLAAQSGLDPLNEWIGNRWSSEQLQFWVRFGCMTTLALIAIAARVWVDIAQLDCVAHERPAIRHSLGRARRLLRGNFLRVYGSVLAIQVLLAVVTLALLWAWTRFPHEAIGRTFLIGEFIVLLWIGGRLWQKSAETVWFHQRDIAEQSFIAA